MEVPRQPLQEGECCPYGEFVGRDLSEGLVLVFMPSLVALLDQAEQLTGVPLTEDQVIRVRDAALVVVTQPHPAAAVEHARGYPDVDPTRPWESWQTIRENKR